jgi:hypothetical protein
MGDDDKSVASVNSTLPRCDCSWKSCRTYQRALRDSDPPHEVLNGVVKVKFTQSDEQSMALKSAFDRYLQVGDSKKETWKDGEKRYFVARHHFTEAMIQKYLKAKKSWNWNEPLTKKDATKLLWELKDEDSCKIADEETGYLKVPNVPKDHVKETIKSSKSRSSLQDSISDMSTKSSKSTKSTKGSKSKKEKDKVTKVASSLENMLDSLSPQSDQEKTPSSKQASVSVTSAKSSKSQESSSKSKVKSPKQSHKKSPKSEKNKVPKDKLEGKMPSMPSLGEDEKKVSKGDHNLQQRLFEETAKAESALEDVSVTSAKSSKSHQSRKEEDESSSKSKVKSPKRSPKSEKNKVSKDKLEGKMPSMLGFGEDEKKVSKGDHNLQHRLLEETAKAESALEDLAVSKEEVKALKKEIEELTAVRVRDAEGAAAEAQNLRQSVTEVNSKHEKTIGALEQELKDYNEKYEKLESANKEMKNDLQEERAEVQKAQEKLQMLEKEVEEMREAVRVRDAEGAAAEAQNLRQSVTELNSKHEKTIGALEQELKDYNEKYEKLESTNREMKEQQTKLTGLSTRRLLMVQEMTTKYEGEVSSSQDFESDLREERAEGKKSQEKLQILEKEVEEMREGHMHETEDFIQSCDDLKRRISTLEEENLDLIQELKMGTQARGLPGLSANADDSKRVAELQDEVEKLKEKNRKLAYMTTPSGSELSLAQAIETLERERESLMTEKTKLSTLNQNQKRVIRSLEGTMDWDSDEARKRAQREDDMEKGAALLANLYFTKKNVELLERQGSNVDFATGLDTDTPQGGQQAELLKQVMERKQQKWWKSLDGIFSYSNYVEEAKQ